MTVALERFSAVFNDQLQAVLARKLSGLVSHGYCLGQFRSGQTVFIFVLEIFTADQGADGLWAVEPFGVLDAFGKDRPEIGIEQSPLVGIGDLDVSGAGVVSQGAALVEGEDGVGIAKLDPVETFFIGESTDISIVISFNSGYLTGGKRGSSVAEEIATCWTVLYMGRSDVKRPIHPRR